ncbi:MAG: hypothetical protein KDG52_13650 [Rhodocyclaceae bacterium]|nr:hypothetical protein [Rhodocyclaceae bacterium]
MSTDNHRHRVCPAPTTATPLSGRVLLALGIATLLAGLAVMAGLGDGLHPLLAMPGAGLALVVSAVALLASAAFPIVIARLTARAPETGCAPKRAAPADGDAADRAGQP